MGDPSEILSDNTKFSLLQLAVHAILELRNVKEQANQFMRDNFKDEVFYNRTSGQTDASGPFRTEIKLSFTDNTPRTASTK